MTSKCDHTFFPWVTRSPTGESCSHCGEVREFSAEEITAVQVAIDRAVLSALQKLNEDQMLTDTEDSYGVAIYCTVCKRMKKPLGRDSMDNGLCDHECPGYDKKPCPMQLWPGELYSESGLHNAD